MWITLKVFLAVFLIINLAKCELYSSLSDLEDLVKTEEVFIGDLEYFVVKQEKLLELSKKKLSYLENEYSLLINDTSRYLSNPLSSFLMILKLTKDDDIISELSEYSAPEGKMDHVSLKLSSAVKSDFVGSIMGLLRLQKIYGLTTYNLENEITNTGELTSQDCFEIGKWLVDHNQEHEFAVLWLYQALKRFDEESFNHEIVIIEILKYLMKAFSLSGSQKKANFLENELKELNDENIKNDHAYDAHESSENTTKGEIFVKKASFRKLEILSKLEFEETERSKIASLDKMSVPEIHFSDLEPLARIEKLFIRDLSDLIERQYEILEWMKKKLENFKQEHLNFENDPGKYLWCPLNIFLAIKRLTTDMDKLLYYSASQDLMSKVEKYNLTNKVPLESDLIGSITGILRLQKMYNLSTSDLSKGVIDGVKYRDELTIEDCYEIGKRLFETKNEYDYAIKWLNKALERYNRNFTSFEMNKINVMQLLMVSYNRTEMYKSAYHTAIKIREIDPQNELAKIVHQSSVNYFFENHNKTHIKLYEEACQGVFQKTSEELSKLKCFYVTNTSAFVRIAPLKAEKVNEDPQVLLFHDVVYDNEIEIIKNLSKSNLQRSATGVDGSGPTKVRVSKTTWLRNDKHEVVKRISTRVDDMTGLSMETVESLQPQVYGIGGHYSLHSDYLLHDWKGIGDRIATVLFYFSDVEKGGATVFPFLKISVKPAKGTAVFWYNLLDSGTADERTLHAACPVLIGAKWAANFWIHERGQIFRRPCGLLKTSSRIDYSQYFD